MPSSQLKIDTSVGGRAGPSSAKLSPRERIITPASSSHVKPLFEPNKRRRRTSNASSSSSLSIISPTSSSTNASTSSLHLPSSASNPLSHPRASLVSPIMDETVRPGTEYVLAMHDFAPQHQNATCLSFRAGQVIHLLNRDTSGWWDGELEGRRGWFPSNYVNADIKPLTEEQAPNIAQHPRKGHKHTMSASSATSWASVPSRGNGRSSHHHRRSSLTEPDVDSYCPPLMVPVLRALSLLQSVVRVNRVAHFQPSTAYIISCVRAVLSATECLSREAPLLQQFPILFQERKQILSVLASLVAQAKKVSEVTVHDRNQEIEVEAMLRLGGQVFVHVRRFLAVAVQCGVDLPDRPESSGSLGGSTDTERHSWRQDETFRDTSVSYEPDGAHLPSPFGTTPTRNREVVATQGYALRARSMGDLKNRVRMSMDEESYAAVPLLPNRLPKSKEEIYLLRERSLRGNGHKGHMLSVSSTTSSSSFSSIDSIGTAVMPPFPCGPSTTAQVIEALRYTHDHYISTIAAFIGHAHSHSRSSHASSTGHMYDLVREIVDMVCKLLTIVESVMRHPDLPSKTLGNLKGAKEGLYNVTSSLAGSVRLLTISVHPDMGEEDEKQALLRSATGALKAGADCVAAVKICLTRSHGERPFIIDLPSAGESGPQPFTPSRFTKWPLTKSNSMGALSGSYRYGDDQDLTIQARSPSPPQLEPSRESEDSGTSSSRRSFEISPTIPAENKFVIASSPIEADLPSPTSLSCTDDGTTWEGSQRHQAVEKHLEEKVFNGNLPSVPLESIPELMNQDPMARMLSHDYALEDVAYNSDGHLVGATMDVLVEKMTPHDSIVDPAFSAVFFLTFRLFSSPSELVEAIVARYNLDPPQHVSDSDLQLWQQRKGLPVRLRVSNFIKLWLEMYWRPAVDHVALPALTKFTEEGLSVMFPGPSQRILDLIKSRENATDLSVSPKGDRIRDPGMSINPPSAIPTSEIPRPTMTKTLLAALRNHNFSSIAITDFDGLELARQLTIMECNLYCAIQPEEVLETSQEGVKPPINVRAVSSLSTVITGWVAESILDEHDIKKRTVLVKFFIKVADRCVSLHNYSTPRSILAALDSSTISRLHQTWLGVPQKNKSQLESLRRLADHGRNYYEYRSKLRNTAPPAVPFLGLYLTDVTFCHGGNPSHRASPVTPNKKLLNFNKYHKLARIVQDMQRFQVPYNLKAIPEVQEFLNVAFQKSRHHGDLQDLYRRSLLVEPKQPADTAPASDMRQLFNWATRSQTQQVPHSAS